MFYTGKGNPVEMSAGDISTQIYDPTGFNLARKTDSSLATGIRETIGKGLTVKMECLPVADGRAGIIMFEYGNGKAVQYHAEIKDVTAGQDTVIATSIKTHANTMVGIWASTGVLNFSDGLTYMDGTFRINVSDDPSESAISDISITSSMNKGRIFDCSVYASKSLDDSITDVSDRVARVRELVVAQDGSGDYTNISDALSYAKTVSTEQNPVTIRIKSGIYEEYFSVSDSIRLIGDDTESCVIRSYPTTRKYTIDINGSGRIENLTVVSALNVGLSEIPHPAYAVHVDSPNVIKAEIINCVLISEQTTSLGVGLQVDSQIIVRDCVGINASPQGVTINFHGNSNTTANAIGIVEGCIFASSSDTVLTGRSFISRNNLFVCESNGNLPTMELGSTGNAISNNVQPFLEIARKYHP